MHSFHSCVCMWRLEQFYRVPIEFALTLIRMWFIFGWTTVYIVLGITVLIYANRTISNYISNDREHFEEGKKNEELGRITHESFENIRAIKQYGWDDFFLGKMSKLHKDILRLEEERKTTDYLNWAMTAILPQLITPLTFVISIAMGNVLNFGDSVELLALIDKARHPIERVVDIQREMVNLKISLLRVNEYMS